ARLCAGELIPLLQREGDVPDLLCPVPLGTKRLRERGYNQALEIARPLARALRLRLDARLPERVEETDTQAGVSGVLRRATVGRAVAVAPHAAALLKDRHVGVVDDVMTTGATLGEIGTMLKRAGAARITNIVFARTPPH